MHLNSVIFFWENTLFNYNLFSGEYDVYRRRGFGEIGKELQD